MYDAHLSGRTCIPRSVHLRSTSERAAWWASGEDNIVMSTVAKHRVWVRFSLLQGFSSEGVEGVLVQHGGKAWPISAQRTS